MKQLQLLTIKIGLAFKDEEIIHSGLEVGLSGSCFFAFLTSLSCPSSCSWSRRRRMKWGMDIKISFEEFWRFWWSPQTTALRLIREKRVFVKSNIHFCILYTIKQLNTCPSTKFAKGYPIFKQTKAQKDRVQIATIHIFYIMVRKAPVTNST